MPNIFKVKQDKGLALMLAVMILSLVMLTGLILNSMVLNEVKISVNTANVVNAYYAAESGIERGLYYLTAQRENNIDLFEDLASYDASDPYVFAANGASYAYDVVDIKAPIFTAYNVSNTSPAHASVIDPRLVFGSGPISWSTEGTVGAYVNWEVDNCFPDHASDRLEITAYSFERDFQNPSVNKFLTVCDCESGISSCDYAQLNLYTNKYYRFVFRPLDSTVKSLNFKLNDPNYILSEALLRVDGKYKNSQYRLQATMSALKPTSDIFDYVIFSEEDITKGDL